MVGVTKAQMITENVEKPAPKQDIQKQQANERKKINETRKRMAEAMGQDAYKEVFKDVEPIRESNVGQHSPLANSDPSDAGKGKPVHVEVYIKNQENLEKMIKRFSRKVKKSGILEEVRERRRFIKKSVKRRLKRLNKKRLAQEETKKYKEKFND